MYSKRVTTISLLERQYVILVVGLLFIISSSLLSLFVFVHFGELVESGSYQYVIDIYPVSLGILVLLGVCTGLRKYTMELLGERVRCRLQADLYAQIMRMPYYVLSEKETGFYVSLLTNDTMVIKQFYGSSLSQILRGGLTIVVGIVMMAMMSWKLLLCSLLICPIALAVLLLTGKKIGLYARDVQEVNDRMSSAITQSIQSLEVIKCFNAEATLTHKFNGNINLSLVKSTYLLRIESLMSSLLILMVFGGLASIALYGLELVNFQIMTIGELTSFMGVLFMVAMSFASISGVFAKYKRTQSSMARINKLLMSAQATRLESLLSPIENVVSIAFHNVSFTYPNTTEKALDDVSVTFTIGENIALIGNSGAGKSTLFKLLLKIYLPTSGEILVNGVNINDLSSAMLRERFSVVLQEHFILDGTILENISFGKEVNFSSKIETAARKAECLDFINRLPHAWNTTVGDGANKLSGGEKQRLSLARALYKSADVLLLDEATNSLDVKNEHQIQSAIAAASHGSLTLTIAHRLNTIANADRVLFMSKGKIIGDGTASHLSSCCDEYKEFMSLHQNMLAT